jgi:hypothetical protein
MQEVTREERRQFHSFWATQRRAIEGRVSEKTMRWVNIYTAKENVGFEMGELRPGKLGQWDLYHWLTDLEINCDENEALFASGLTATEVAEEKGREYFEENYVDPDNPREIATFERLRGMGPAELNEEIGHLEAILAIQ